MACRFDYSTGTLIYNLLQLIFLRNDQNGRKDITMVDINYDKWTVDSHSRKALHESGLYIEFSGFPSSSNFSGNPKNIPGGLTAFEQVRLIRHGFEVYRAAFEESSPALPVNSQKSPLRAKSAENSSPPKTKITVKKRRRIVPDTQES